MERTFRLHVLPVWGERRIQDIGRRDVVELLDSLVDRGTPCWPMGCSRMCASCLTGPSTAPSSRRRRVSAFRRRRPKRARDRVLSDDELRLVWKAADRMGWPFGRFIQTLMLTVQRRDEVAGMRRPEIKEGGNLWTISGERTKNGTAHDVPLSDAAQADPDGGASPGGSALRVHYDGETPISGYSKAKERLDAIMLEIAREEALARGDDPSR